MGRSALGAQVHLLQSWQPSHCCPWLLREVGGGVGGSHQAEELRLHPEGREQPVDDSRQGSGGPDSCERI